MLLFTFAAIAQLVAAAPTLAPRWPTCTPENIRTRVDFASMKPCHRKDYTDAIKCIMSKPSSLDQSLYPAAINRYQDYAVIHVGRTGQVHLSGYFLTWHRYFAWLFEEDLRKTCGYKGPFPYWDFGLTAGNLEGSAVFDGSEYSMSGNGAPNNTGPIALGPNLIIPHGSGGGCVTTGPFANLITTIAYIDPLFLVTGAPLPPNTYALNQSCLQRDLNDYVASTYTNTDLIKAATHAPNASAFELALNGIIGGNSLGIHSAAHFEVGGGLGQMGSIHVSVQDPVWWMLHTMIDRVYVSWQTNNPSQASGLDGTMTALNTPPSANVTLDSIEPDFGYFQPNPITVGELISNTGGPFCYQYDTLIS